MKAKAERVLVAVNGKQRVLLVFGTRPEAIKLLPVFLALRARPDAFDLDLMRKGQSLAELNAAILDNLRPVLLATKPDLVLVQGDTTTSMAAALAAFYERIPVAHVEAGLRTDRIDAPFPEELNRRVAGLVSRYHFAPTEAARQNLLREGYAQDAVMVVGNTVVDAVRMVLARLDDKPAFRKNAESILDAAFDFDWRQRDYVLVTCHRRENQAQGLDEISRALSELSERHSDVRFALPVHPNPNVRNAVRAALSDHRGICLTEPLPYPAFLLALRHCSLVLTDSGGIQEEAPSLGKPVLVMREHTERIEGEEAGHARLIGTRCDDIVQVANRLLTDADELARMTPTINPYGDGFAAQRIADFLESRWRDRERAVSEPEMLLTAAAPL